MNRIKFAFWLFISGALLGLFYNLLNDKIHHKEECTASLVVFKGNTQTNLTLNFMYSLDEARALLRSAVVIWMEGNAGPHQKRRHL